MKNRKKTKGLLKVIFDLIISTNVLNQKEQEPLKSLLEEESHSFGLKIYSQPMENLMLRVDKILDTYCDFEKYPMGGNDLYYCLFEGQVANPSYDYQDKSTGKITVQKGDREKVYLVRSVEVSIEFILEERIEEYIKEYMSKENKSKEESFIDLNVKLLESLLIFHKETSEYSEKFSKALLHYCNPDFCGSGQLWENAPAMRNLEDKIEKPLLKLSSSLMYDDLFYYWRDDYSYGETKQEMRFPSDLKNIDKLDVVCKNQEDFCRWFLQLM